MVNFVYCILLYIREDRRECYQEDEMHSDILTGQRIPIVDFENSKTFM